MSPRFASVYAFPEQADRPSELAYGPRREDDLVETAVVWRVLWDRRRWILACAAACVAAALLYGLVSPSLYTATAQLIIDPRDRQVVSNDVNPSAISPDGGIAQIESQVSVMQSSGVLLGAISATDLAKDPEFNGVGSLGRLFGLIGANASGDASQYDLQARTLAGLRRQLSVKRADKVLVIDVSVASREPGKAAKIANAIVESYLADQARARSDAARHASGALSDRFEEQRRRVEEAEQAIEKYRSENMLVSSGGRLVSDQQLNDLNAQFAVAQNQTALMRAQLDNQTRSRDGTSEAQRSAVVTKLREQESALAENVANLAISLGPRHPSLAAAQAQLQNVRDHIAAELGRVGRALRIDYERALANEHAIAARLEQRKSLSLTNDKALVRLRELQRELDAARSVYASYLQRAQETGEQAGIDTTNARVISRALPPLQRSWPPLSLLVIGAGLAGLGLGSSAALAREYARPRIMSAAQAKSVAGVGFVALLRARKDVPGAPEPDGAAKVSTAISNSKSRRAIQLMLTGLMDDGSANRRFGRIVALTSSEIDASSRRAVAHMIASVASSEGEHVLLVDADVTGATEAAPPGLLDLLRGEDELGKLVRRDRSDAFFVLDKGRAGARPVSWARRNFDDSLLARLRRRFDLVVIDAGVAAENQVATPFLVEADVVLVVAEIAKTLCADLSALAEATELIGAQVTGVMLADASLES